eukprot:2156915-Rhodomonas_salina.1
MRRLEKVGEGAYRQTLWRQCGRESSVSPPTLTRWSQEDGAVEGRRDAEMTQPGPVPFPLTVVNTLQCIKG